MVNSSVPSLWYLLNGGAQWQQPNKSQLEQVNACYMFLQVTTLAEVVDHTGMLILLQVLEPSSHNRPDGLTHLSSSKLQWPCISPPSVASWCLWTQTICNLFTGTPNGTKLQHTLGAWTPAYQDIWEWKWWLSTQGSLLNQMQPSTTPWAAMLTTTQHTKLTFMLTVPTNQPFSGPPVMPYNNYTNHMVTLLIPALPSDTIMTPIYPHHQNLDQTILHHLRRMVKTTVWTNSQVATQLCPPRDQSSWQGNISGKWCFGPKNKTKWIHMGHCKWHHDTMVRSWIGSWTQGRPIPGMPRPLDS